MNGVYPTGSPQSSGEAWLQLYFSPFQRFSRPKRHRPASTSQLRVSQNRGNCLFEWEVTDGVLFSSPSNNGLAEMHNDLRPVYFGTRKSGKELKGIYFIFLFYRGNLQSLNIIFFLSAKCVLNCQQCLLSQAPGWKPLLFIYIYIYIYIYHQET